MRFSLAAAAALAPVLFAAAEDHLILVGANGQLAFSPTNITAAAGDTVSFQFQAKNHSVTQSSFVNPCAIQTTPAPGINSGFQFVSNTSTTLPQWSFTVDNASTPLWFFCAQTTPASHCQAGMVFSVNANPNSAKSFAVYQQAAMGNPAVIESSAAASASGGAAGAAPTDSAGAALTSAGAGAAPTDSSAGAAATDAGNAINSAAALTDAGGASPTGGVSNGNGTSPSAGFRLSGNTFSLVAAVGLTAMLL
ncbi:Cupredoxin [Mycena sanguinolenta]|nr:Cupredoxin [Mycena sanguinolenta]